MKSLWTLLFLKPLYNILILLIVFIPGGNLAIAIIILTVIVRLILAPLSKRSIITQIRQKEIQPEIEEIKNKIKDPKKQSEKIFAVYKKNKVNPFASILLILIQLPIIIALYQVIRLGGAENVDLLYSFVQFPESVSIMFLGFIDLSARSVVLALLAGATQYLQIKLSPNFQQMAKNNPKNQQEKIVGSIQKKMQFSLPIMITVFAYMLPSAMALYWSVSNIYTLLQEVVVRKRYNKKVNNNIPEKVENPM